MIVSKDFEFAASHFLTKYHGKCERLHGHNYKIRISVEGKIGENGMVVDFVLLKKLVKERVLDRLDHCHLNDLFENPTAEIMVKWIWNELHPLSQKLQPFYQDPNFPPEIAQLLQEAQGAKLDNVGTDIRLSEVILWETDSSSVTYRGESSECPFSPSL